ncbi:MAG: UDP-N-acetylglucosamine 1-carboxyvinyltransferase [Huintestinicola sp.]
MQKLVIEGGKRLEGEITVQGSKNALLPVMAAAVLCKGKTVLSNCPVISDRFAASRILTALGAGVSGADGIISVDCSEINDSPSIDSKLMSAMRSSVIFMGALLGRCGRCTLCYPGGCDLGPRPIDMHLSALRKMGAVINDSRGIIECSAPHGLKGCTVSLPFPSVGATENIMLAAASAEGETVISNSAREPEIVCLADFLRSCGAEIKGDGGGRIVIEGRKLSPPEEVFSIIPDRIVAATYLSCAACTGGDIMLTGCIPAQLEAVISVFEQMGAYVRCFGTNIYIYAGGRLKAVDTIRTMVYPGFPTDVQAIVMAPLCTAAGTTVFVENIFENRYRHTSALCRMGADIRAEGKVAVVRGVEALSGACSEAPDLRGGAAILCAALGAQGVSEISGIEHIDRGYEAIEKVLSSVGADIKRK